MSRYTEWHVEIRHHPKTLRLAKILGCRRTLALGYVGDLIAWTGLMAPDGDLSSFAADDIEVALEWEGAAGVLVEALLTCGRDGQAGYLERTAHGLAVHDWRIYAAQWRDAQRKAAERAQKRYAQDSPGPSRKQTDGPGKSASRARARRRADPTGPDPTGPDPTGPDPTGPERATGTTSRSSDPISMGARASAAPPGYVPAPEPAPAPEAPPAPPPKRPPQGIVGGLGDVLAGLPAVVPAGAGERILGDRYRTVRPLDGSQVVALGVGLGRTFAGWQIRWACAKAESAPGLGDLAEIGMVGNKRRERARAYAIVCLADPPATEPTTSGNGRGPTTAPRASEAHEFEAAIRESEERDRRAAAEGRTP